MLKKLKLLLTKIHRSKTLVVSTVLAVVGVVEQNTQAFAPYMTANNFGLFVTGIGALMAVLRVYTTTSLEEK